jgi:alpha-amylase
MWPDDLKIIYSRLNNLRSDIFGPDNRPFIANEIIDRGGEAISYKEYLGAGRYTNLNFGAIVTTGMWRKMDINQLADLRPGYLYGNGLDTDVVNFIDNHDNQRDPQRYVMNYNDGIKYAMGVGYMLAWVECRKRNKKIRKTTSKFLSLQSVFLKVVF